MPWDDAWFLNAKMHACTELVWPVRGRTRWREKHFPALCSSWAHSWDPPVFNSFRLPVWVRGRYGIRSTWPRSDTEASATSPRRLSFNCACFRNLPLLRQAANGLSLLLSIRPQLSRHFASLLAWSQVWVDGLNLTAAVVSSQWQICRSHYRLPLHRPSDLVSQLNERPVRPKSSVIRFLLGVRHRLS